jgi:hypothetical protein
LAPQLQALIEQVGLAAKAAGTGLAIFIDELQYLPEAQLAALITALHRTEQRQLPVAALDESFFRVRFDRCTPKEKKYLRAMAELGEGPHRSGDIAACLKVDVTSLAPARSSLISKGMVWSPSHGDTAFTVPMFDEFMKRIIPGDAWR